MRFPPVLVVPAACLLVVLAGCAATSVRNSGSDSSDGSGIGGTAGSGSRNGAVHELPTSGIPDYQLGGAYTPDAAVTIVERDSTSKPVSGLYSICYVNGFQTQGGDENALWLRAHGADVLRDAAGKPLHDPDWPDEMILDTSTASTRADIAGVLGKSIDECAAKGFDAVEFDNLDSYTRFAGRLTAADNLALAKLLVARAHADDLAAGQKNTPDLSRRAKAVGYDFAVSEECLTYSECSSYTEVYGKRVIDIEYTDDVKGTWASNCASRKRPAMTILRDRDLVPRGNKAYVFEHC